MKTLLRTLTAAAMAASFSSMAAAGPATIALRAVTMADNQPGPELYAHSGGKQPGAKVNVKTFLNHESDVVNLESSTLVLTTKPEPASATDKDSVVATFKVDPALKSCIVLFLAGEGGNGVVAELIDDGKAAFPPGSILMINALKSDIKLTLETKDYSVKSASRLLIQNPPVGESNASAVKAFYQQGGSFQQFSSTSWPHPGIKRVIQVATEGRQAGKPEMRGIKDIIKVK